MVFGNNSRIIQSSLRLRVKFTKGFIEFPYETLSNVLVNSYPGKSIKVLTKNFLNKQVGVTNVEETRKIGGKVEPSPTLKNPYHATLSGLTSEQAQWLFTPTIPNPNIKPRY